LGWSANELAGGDVGSGWAGDIGVAVDGGEELGKADGVAGEREHIGRAGLGWEFDKERGWGGPDENGVRWGGGWEGSATEIGHEGGLQ